MVVKDRIKSGEIVTFCVTEQESSLYNEIEEFIISSSFSHFRQSVSWMQCHRYEEPYLYIISKKETKIVAVSLVRQRKIPLIGKSKYFIDRGPVVSDVQYLSAHLEGIKELLKKSALWIRINPYIWGDERDDAKRYIEDNKFIKTNASVYNETIVLDLTQSESDLWKGLRRALKTQINKADKLGIKVEHVTTESDLKEFVQNYNVFARHKSIPQISKTISRSLYKRIFSDEGHGHIWLARHKGKIVSGVAIIISADRAIYEWGFKNLNSENKFLPVSHKLHWEAILWLKQKGLRFYDFGGYDAAEDPSYGLNHFKLGFSKHKQKVMSEWQVVCDPLWNSLSEATNFFKKF